MTLKTEEFIRRFLQHVLLSGFVKVRYFGLFASANRELLSIASELLNCKIKDKLKKHKSNNKSIVFNCPACNKKMTIAFIIPRPSKRYNKAPPKMNMSINNFNLSYCA